MTTPNDINISELDIEAIAVLARASKRVRRRLAYLIQEEQNKTDRVSEDRDWYQLQQMKTTITRMGKAR